MHTYKHMRLSLVFTLVLLLGACSPNKDQDLEEIAHKEHRTPKGKLQRLQEKTEGYIFGEPLFELANKKSEDSNIGVNSYLWRASLDVSAPLPKKRIDPFGGAILTEWHLSQNNPNERLKMEIIIIGRQLRSDALRVSIFRQKKIKGTWVDQTVSEKTNDTVEETILKRARAIRIQEER